jgi:chromate transporter
VRAFDQTDVLGVIANLALWFALHVVFCAVGTMQLPLAVSLPLPVSSSIQFEAALMLAAATLALLRFKVGVIR